MSATITATAPRRKLTKQSPPRRTAAPAAPEPGALEPSSLELWEAIARTRFHTGAREIGRSAKKLVAQIEAFLRTQSARALAAELRAAGLEGHAEAATESAADLIADIKGLLYVLDLSAGLISGQAYQLPEVELAELGIDVREKLKTGAGA